MNSEPSSPSDLFCVGDAVRFSEDYLGSTRLRTVRAMRRSKRGTIIWLTHLKAKVQWDGWAEPELHRYEILKRCKTKTQNA